MNRRVFVGMLASLPVAGVLFRPETAMAVPIDAAPVSGTVAQGERLSHDKALRAFAREFDKRLSDLPLVAERYTRVAARRPNPSRTYPHHLHVAIDGVEYPDHRHIVTAARALADACREKGITRFGHLPLLHGLRLCERIKSGRISIRMTFDYQWEFGVDIGAAGNPLIRFDVLGGPA